MWELIWSLTCRVMRCILKICCFLWLLIWCKIHVFLIKGISLFRGILIFRDIFIFRDFFIFRGIFTFRRTFIFRDLFIFRDIFISETFLYSVTFFIFRDIFYLQMKVLRAKTELLLKPGTGPWTRTLKNLDPENPGPWKTWTEKNLHPEKHGINIGLKICLTLGSYVPKTNNRLLVILPKSFKNTYKEVHLQ